jgi:integrase
MAGIKAAVGSVGIESKDGKYRLRLPRTLVGSGSRYISTKLPINPENSKRVQIVAWEIEAAIQSGDIAQSIDKFRDSFKPLTLDCKPKVLKFKPLSLVELWVLYCEYKKPQLAATTYRLHHTGVLLNHFKKLPQDLSDPIAIRDAILSTVSADTAKRLLTALSVCCAWGASSGLIGSNPFQGMAAAVSKPKESKDINPFSRTERDRILEAFQQHNSYRYYYPLIKFLFLTGCRTGEALALRWDNVASDYSSITFSESYSGKLRLVKGTKTGKTRRFPCNKDLRDLLMFARSQQTTGIVFPNHVGGFMDGDRLTYGIWRLGVLKPLVASKAVESYRCIYTTRHTFITMLLSAGLTCSQVAKLVGNSPEVILRHYAGGAVDEVPRI